MGLTDAAAAVAAEQDGVVTRRQLLAAGVSAETLRWRVGRDWRLLLPGVYVLQTGLPSQVQRLMAAQLLAGNGAWLAGSTAAALHGIRSCSVTVPIRVLVPAPRRSRRIAWVDIRGTALLGEPVLDRGPLRVGSLARAVVRLRTILTEVSAGAWSVPEADLLTLLRTSGRLPHATANPLLTGPGGETLTSPDVWFDDVGMAVMVQSRTFHADGLDWDATVEAGADLSAMRVVVVGVTPSALARDPAGQLARIERAHADAARTGIRAPVRAVERPTVPLGRFG